MGAGNVSVCRFVPGACHGPVQVGPGRIESRRSFQKMDGPLHTDQVVAIPQRLPLQETSDKRGQWSKQPKDEPLQMYVMMGAFAKTGERRDRKGHEPWTLDTDAGKQQAEQLFTVIGITQREMKPLFSPIIYPLATEDGITTFAQAIYYNGNEQKPEPVVSTTNSTTNSKAQAKIGWDTLNWNPASTTPEWGAEPFESSAKWPWDLFKSETTFVGTAQVRLNWQAKLMPVTESRFGEAATASLVNPKMGFNLTKARLFFKQMVTH